MGLGSSSSQNAFMWKEGCGGPWRFDRSIFVECLDSSDTKIPNHLPKSRTVIAFSQTRCCALTPEPWNPKSTQLAQKKIPLITFKPPPSPSCHWTQAAVRLGSGRAEQFFEIIVRGIAAIVWLVLGLPGSNFGQQSSYHNLEQGICIDF